MPLISIVSPFVAFSDSDASLRRSIPIRQAKSMTHPALRCVAAASVALLSAAAPAMSAGCAFELQGEGRVAAVTDARTFRLDDGREVRLAGIEPATPDKAR